MKAESPRKLLVTGASGFIGRHAVEALLREDSLEVHATSRGLPAQNAKLNFHRADLLLPGVGRRLIEAIRPTDLLCMAWCSNPKIFWTDPLNPAWCDSMRELIEAFYENGGRHVVVAGSGAEYDWTALPPFSETTTPAKPATLYGQCKNELRLWLESTAPRYKGTWSWGRIFWTFGPGEPAEKLVAYVIAQLLAGEPALLGPLNIVRDYLYAPDIAGAFSLLVKHRHPGVYNIASGHGLVPRDLVHAIGRLLHREDLLRIGAKPAPADEIAEIVADNGRLRGLGWRPAFSLDAALQATIREMRLDK